MTSLREKPETGIQEKRGRTGRSGQRQSIGGWGSKGPRRTLSAAKGYIEKVGGLARGGGGVGGGGGGGWGVGGGWGGGGGGFGWVAVADWGNGYVGQAGYRKKQNRVLLAGHSHQRYNSGKVIFHLHKGKSIQENMM